MAKRHKSYNYKFAERKHSSKGIAGLIVSLGSIGVGVALILLSYRQGGTGGNELAMGGVASLIAAFLGFGLALAGVREAERRRLFSILALFFSVAALAGWIGIYVLGFLYG